MDKPPKPGPLRPGDKKNFETLLAAAENGDLAVISAIRRSDNANVALICALGEEDKLEIRISPLAVMVEGNPYELFYDPMDDNALSDPERVQQGRPVASQNATQLALSRAAEAIQKEAQDVRHNEDYRLAAATLAKELSGRASSLV